MIKILILSCLLAISSTGMADKEAQDLFEKKSGFLYNRILDEINLDLAKSTTTLQYDFDKYYNISRDDFDSQSYSSCITFSNKALRTTKNIPDAKLEVLRYQLGISYAV